MSVVYHLSPTPLYIPYVGVFRYWWLWGFGIHVKVKEWQHGVWGPGVLVYIEGRYMQVHMHVWREKGGK